MSGVGCCLNSDCATAQACDVSSNECVPCNTGLAEVDELLRKVQLLPTHVSQLELTPEEKSLPRKKRREALEARCERGFVVNATELLDLMSSIIKYPRANYFELVCALSFMSGRGLPEILGVAEFSPQLVENNILVVISRRLICEKILFISILT